MILRKNLIYDTADCTINNFSQTSEYENEIKILRKIQQDCFYRDTFIQYGTLESVYEAGYFNDNFSSVELKYLMNPKWLCTPLFKIFNNIRQFKNSSDTKKTQPFVVLLTTGGFAPVHQGHLRMMHIAKEKLKQKGFKVVGGFFSPSHDNYMAKKFEKTHALTAVKRISILNNVLDESHWLAVDPWEALYVPVEINFTTVVKRLENYLKVNLPAYLIKVAYVFGSDNAYFYRAFCKQGISVCIARPGSEEKLKKSSQEAIFLQNQNIFFSDLRKKHEISDDISSSVIRQKNQNVKKFLGFTSENNNFFNSFPYLIRDDLEWATQLWASNFEKSILKIARKKFLLGLGETLKNIFYSSNNNSFPKYIDIVILSSERQKKFIKKLSKKNHLLNLDIITASEDNLLNFSRLFALSDAQTKPICITKRPIYKNFSQQLNKIKPGNYYLVDDDIITGSTMNKVEDLLPKSIKIIDRISLSEIEYKSQTKNNNKPYHFWDLIDARDFLIGSRSSGLIVELFNGDVARAPYLLPFVSLANRLSLPPETELKFTQAILKLNKDFFKSFSYDLTIHQLDEGFQKLLMFMGFSQEDSILKVIDWLEKFLNQDIQS